MPLHRLTCSEALGRAEAQKRRALQNPDLTHEEDERREDAEDELAEAELAVRAALNREGCL